MDTRGSSQGRPINRFCTKRCHRRVQRAACICQPGGTYRRKNERALRNGSPPSPHTMRGPLCRKRATTGHPPSGAIAQGQPARAPTQLRTARPGAPDPNPRSATVAASTSAPITPIAVRAAPFARKDRAAPVVIVAARRRRPSVAGRASTRAPMQPIVVDATSPAAPDRVAPAGIAPAAAPRNCAVAPAWTSAPTPITAADAIRLVVPGRAAPAGSVRAWLGFRAAAAPARTPRATQVWSMRPLHRGYCLYGGASHRLPGAPLTAAACVDTGSNASNCGLCAHPCAAAVLGGSAAAGRQDPLRRIVRR
jgi:hypothetical protein